MIKRTALLTLMLLPTFATAVTITGRTVKDWLDETRAAEGRASDPASLRTGQLNGYLVGVAETLILTRNFCPPANQTQKELLAIIDKHLEHDYANRDKPATPRVMQILKQAYPCIPQTPRKPGREQNV